MTASKSWRSALIIDPVAGQVHRQMPSGATRRNIGSDNGHGYKRINMQGRFECVHRLIVLEFGPIPDWMEVDHINGDRADNRAENLRLVTRQGNLQNQRSPQKRNRSSKFLGVSFCKRTGRWESYITADGKRRHLGRFSTEEDAHAAYVAAKRNLHATCSI